MDSKKGPLAIVLVKQGTLTTGTSLYQKGLIGKAKALLDSDGQVQTVALPSTPVEILGLLQVPQVGSQISNVSINQESPAALGNKTVTTSKQFNFIVKADVAGSLEAILTGLNPEAGVITSGTGDVNENDVLLARTSGAIILTFNVRLPGSVAKLAETEKVQIADFRIIYELFKFVDDLISPKSTEKIVGKAAILADFKINSDRIAGCKCTEGTIERVHTIKIYRQNKLIAATHIKSLHQGKNIIEKAKTGMEFGAVFSPYVDFNLGDDIIATIG